MQPDPLTPNIWHYKPWWCQPWSILLTGFGLIAGSWLLFHTGWLTLLVGLPVTTWMVYFVVVYPRAIAQSGLLETLHQDMNSGEGDRPSSAQ